MDGFWLMWSVGLKERTEWKYSKDLFASLFFYLNIGGVRVEVCELMEMEGNFERWKMGVGGRGVGT